MQKELKQKKNTLGLSNPKQKDFKSESAGFYGIDAIIYLFRGEYWGRERRRNTRGVSSY